MLNKESKEKKIIVAENRAITRKELFERKEQFHKDQAKLPFEDKIKILVKMQQIAKNIKGDSENILIWNI